LTGRAGACLTGLAPNGPPNGSALRLKATEGIDSCQLYFSTTADPGTSHSKQFSFGLNPDGEWHTYQVSKEPHGQWSGALKILRLDIGAPGAALEVDWVRFYGKTP